jgi:Sec-independent protein secretion pathway component TatC
MNPYNKAAAYAGLAFVVPVAMYVCYEIGVWADGKLGTHYFYVIGIMAGFAAGIYEMIRQANRIERGPRDKR